MILKRITLENIRSYEDQVIEFPKGTTLLSGGIGTGKTSILLAIEYALFGLQPGQRGAALLAHAAQTGKVMLEIEIGGREVTIERSLKRTAKTVSQESAAITIDGAHSESSVTEIKTKVLELLNYPLEFIKKTNILYRFTVYTPQEEMKQIILEQPESRLNILRHVFGIDKYKKIRENTGVVTAKLREEARGLAIEIRDLDVHTQECENTKSLVKHRTNQILEKKIDLEKRVAHTHAIRKERDDMQEKIKEREKFEKEVEKTSIMLNSKNMQRARDERYIKELQAMITAHKDVFKEDELRDVIAAIGTTKNEIEAMNTQSIEVKSKLKSLQLKHEEDVAKKDRVFKIDLCPTCLQNVGETHKHNILNETEGQIAKYTKEVEVLEHKNRTVTVQLSGLSERLERLESRKSTLEMMRHKMQEVADAKDRVVQVEKGQENTNKDIAFLEEQIAFLKQSVLQFSKYTAMHAQKEKELHDARALEKEVEIEIAQLTKEVEMLQGRVKTLEGMIESLKKIKDRLHHLSDLEKWLSKEYTGLIAHTERTIMMSVRQEFSRVFNKWFGMLTTDAFMVHLDENFTPVITQGEFEVDYQYLSGGERTAVALAYRLALNQIIETVVSNLNTRGLIILDEPTDGFSDAQLDKIRDIIEELQTHQLLIVSHEQKMESFVDNVIKLNKQNGVSEKKE